MKAEIINFKNLNSSKMYRAMYLVVMILMIFLSGDLKSAQETPRSALKYQVKKNIFYKAKDNLTSYEKERCFLDLYLPNSKKEFPVMLWFHGGSLTRCSKDDKFTQDLAVTFARHGIGVAVVNYRLSPQAKYPAYIEDAAASVSWVKKNIQKYDGNPKRIFISGHSAGGYLTYMLGMDEKYLDAFGIKTKDIAGIIPIGGQTFTHYTVRKEMGVPNYKVTPIIDQASPCYHAKKDSPQVIAICGDMDSQDRIEENHYMIALLKKQGHSHAKYLEIANRNHWDLILKIPTPNDPLTMRIVEFIFNKVDDIMH